MAFIRSGGFRILLAFTLFTAFVAGAGVAFLYFNYLRDLPDLRDIHDYQPPLASHLYDRNGREIGVLARERRDLVPVESLPLHASRAFIAAEDSHFFEHAGIDYLSIVRAAWVDLRAGGIKQGASTITMQLVKQLLLSPERRFSRKLREMVLAKRIESHFSKNEILYLYLNQIYFGSGAWGINQASKTYFGKPATELTVSESALLAGLPQRPSAYSPFRNPDLADRRRRYVLGRMHQDSIIDRETYEHALANPPELAPAQSNPDFWTAIYFSEEVRRYLYEALGGDMVLAGGLTIETTLDIDLQRQAVAAVRQGLEAHDRRRGYRGPLREIPEDQIPEAITRLATENKLEPAEDGSFSVLPLAEPQTGIVTEVDFEAGWARIAFAPGIEGQAALEDVAWAREADVVRRPRLVKRIEEIFKVGDVASFTRLEGDPLIVLEEPESEAEDADAGDPVDVDEAVEIEVAGEALDAPAEPEPPPLARVRIYQVPVAQGALISIDVASGEVRAMVGGYDYATSQFNRATQAKRQPGSAFKPFIYGAALSREYTPVSTLWDRPVVYKDPVSGFVWQPENYSKHFYGQMPLRQALVRSVNNATVHLFRDLGVDYVIDYARRLGIHSPLNRDLSLALGSSDVDLVELTAAYAIFPNGGKRVVPRFIRRVTDRNGQVLLENIPLGEPPTPIKKPINVAAIGEEAARRVAARDSEVEEGELELGIEGDVEINVDEERVISEDAAYLMCDLLQAVVVDPRGTGWRLRELGRPLGGKTGTTNDQKDAWFMGFSPDIVTGVWVGRDDSLVLGWSETGSRAAAPIWVDYMRLALDEFPNADFEEPDSIVTVRIDRASGLLADADSDEAYFQPFLMGSEPSETAASRKSAVDTQRAIRRDIF